ncbi:MAG: bifunctional nuclease family protein [Candidatus Hydrothermarchaeaceae archaeon]
MKKELQKVKVTGVYMVNAKNGATPIVFLENAESKILPIYIGASEAFSIQTALENLPYPRPLTHDLIISMLKRLESEINMIIIDELSEGIFFARIIVEKNGEEYEFDARPSDSLALAIRSGAPVYVSNEIMKTASVDKKTYDIK